MPTKSTAVAADTDTSVAEEGIALSAERPDPVASARAEVERLWRTEIEWADRYTARRAELAELETLSGSVALDTPSQIEEHTARVASARAHLHVAEQAIATARARRIDAIRSAYRAEAAELRERASAKRAEAAERQRETDRLLAALRDFEGCEYVPFVPQRTPGSVYSDAVVSYAIPRTRALHIEADNFDRQAAALEAKPVSMHGGIDAGELGDVLNQLRALGAFTLAPSSIAVSDWAAPLVARIEAKRAELFEGMRGYGAPLVISLVWRNGELDPAQSRAYLAGN